MYQSVFSLRQLKLYPGYLVITSYFLTRRKPILISHVLPMLNIN